MLSDTDIETISHVDFEIADTDSMELISSV